MNSTSQNAHRKFEYEILIGVGWTGQPGISLWTLTCDGGFRQTFAPQQLEHDWKSCTNKESPSVMRNSQLSSLCYWLSFTFGTIMKQWTTKSQTTFPIPGIFPFIFLTTENLRYKYRSERWPKPIGLWAFFTKRSRQPILDSWMNDENLNNNPKTMGKSQTRFVPNAMIFFYRFIFRTTQQCTSNQAKTFRSEP